MRTAKSPEMATTALAPENNMGRLFLTVDEAAERLGVKRSWIYERTRRKTIPHRRLGKFVRFTEQDIHAIADAVAIGDLH
ncbi:MAG TPA: helix-turn-helix domain-containing protein [Bryobacteraceae bacterium]|nr:helix-turn-helix domain-containing protein [Bryobacteraceae bacterium]